jgi:hypothetical protein
VSVENCSGRYSPKVTINITADERQVTVRSTDVLELSNTRFLVVHGAEKECSIPWERISNLEFDEQEIISASSRPQSTTARHRILPFHLGKKVV